MKIFNRRSSEFQTIDKLVKVLAERLQKGDSESCTIAWRGVLAGAEKMAKGPDLFNYAFKACVETFVEELHRVVPNVSTGQELPLKFYEIRAHLIDMMHGFGMKLLILGMELEQQSLRNGCVHSGWGGKHKPNDIFPLTQCIEQINYTPEFISFDEVRVERVSARVKELKIPGGRIDSPKQNALAAKIALDVGTIVTNEYGIKPPNVKLIAGTRHYDESTHTLNFNIDRDMSWEKFIKWALHESRHIFQVQLIIWRRQKVDSMRWDSLPPERLKEDAQKFLLSKNLYTVPDLSRPLSDEINIIPTVLYSMNEMENDANSFRNSVATKLGYNVDPDEIVRRQIDLFKEAFKSTAAQVIPSFFGGGANS